MSKFAPIRKIDNIEDIEVEQPRSIFKRNNYPVNILEQCIKEFLDKFYVFKQIQENLKRNC